MTSILDTLGRPLANLRLSVTDRCNLRCAYCMPEEDYAWLPKKSILSFEEIARLVGVFTTVGVTKVRITGGEPLLRRELSNLVRLLAVHPRIDDLALTTNGILLAEQARALRSAGLKRITVSLDTLKPAVFRELAKRDGLEHVLAGIRAARDAGFDALKLDSVMIRGTNDAELCDLLEFAKAERAELRYIEYMDVGGATQWRAEQVVSRAELLTRLAERYGPIEPLREISSAPAERFRLSDGTVFGIIASTTAPFCRSCDRSRLTADGMWYRCLYATQGTNLRDALRSGATDAELADLVTQGWRSRADRGAEERLAEHSRGAFAPREELVKNPHLEMHKRGG
ncbi:MAG: GTP 3',8-cyclase MoaA [Planctomycetes bacterium]|nr:GTP 3',8-cyclase MoaA [Planctomycetota bacterium]